MHTGTITPTDFGHPSDIHGWTPGHLRHLIRHLGDRTVVITVDKQSGFTLVAARLTGLTTGPYNGEPRLAVQTPTDAGTMTTHYPLADIGPVIIPLPRSRSDIGAGQVRFDTISGYRSEVNAAIRMARELHGETEGRGWGRWYGRCSGTGVYVTYTPSSTAPPGVEAGTTWSRHLTTQDITDYHSLAAV